MKQRIDRAQGNTELIKNFPQSTIIHLPMIESDHCPIMLDQSKPQQSYPKPFHFQAMWVQGEGYKTPLKIDGIEFKKIITQKPT